MSSINSHREAAGQALVLGRYRVIRALARGGMGVVYLARTEGAAGFARPVVLKRIIPDLASEEAATRAFVREARILSNLQHPGIVNVIDFGEEDEAYVMVLEYVHGYTLAQWQHYVFQTRRKFPVDPALLIMVRVLSALHYAHTYTRPDGTLLQIVHRDISPGNVAVELHGSIKLLDFGIARIDETGEYKTKEGHFKGKLTYAAPEVYNGLSATPQSDIYSAAVVLYQLLSGSNPFRGQDLTETVRRVLLIDAAPLSTLRDDLPDGLDALLVRAMAKDPSQRPRSAGAFADALRALLRKPEQEVTADIAQLAKEDFTSDMATRLGLEPLHELDAAWRAAAEDPERAPELDSTPPPAEGAARAKVLLRSRDPMADRDSAGPIGSEPPTVTPGVRRTDAIAPAPPGATSRPGRRGATSNPSSEPPTIEVAPKARSNRWPLALAALVGVGAVALVVARSFGNTDPAPSAFVVVERLPATATSMPADEPATEPVASSVAAPSEPVASASPVQRVAPPPAERSSASGRTDAASLSRTFQKRRPAIESCFRSHASEVEGRPEISVRFKVAPSGGVESATLNPASLSGTPLGACLLGVARATNFGSQPEPVTFAIPITARRVP